MTQKHIKLIFFVLLAVFLAICFKTFYDAKGFSYFTNKSETCNNCHVMNEVYNDYQKSSHAWHATCSDCHLPQDFIPKWLEKAKNGLKHGYAFTFVTSKENLTASARSKEIVQMRCKSCHNKIASSSINPTLNSHENALNCVSCHKSVGHKRGF